MKRLAIAMVASLALALALLLAACDDDGGAPPESSPTRTPPADPAARFQELEALRKAASFHIIYDEDRGFSGSEEFAWSQDGKRVRWEEVNTGEDALGGLSSIDDGTGSGLTCSWVTKKDWTAAQVGCDDVPRSEGMWILDRQVNGPSVFQESVEFAGFGMVLDMEVECFTATSLNRDTRGICYSTEGMPLRIVSAVRGGADYGIALMAKEIRPPPSEEELLTPIIPDASLGRDSARREIPLDDLVLPDMPIIEDFFSEAEE